MIGSHAAYQKVIAVTFASIQARFGTFCLVGAFFMGHEVCQSASRVWGKQGEASREGRQGGQAGRAGKEGRKETATASSSRQAAAAAPNSNRANRQWIPRMLGAAYLKHR